MKLNFEKRGLLLILLTFYIADASGAPTALPAHQRPPVKIPAAQHGRRVVSANLKIRSVDLVVEGSDKRSADNTLLREYIEKISSTPRVSTALIERYVLLINKIPGYEARWVLTDFQRNGDADSAGMVLYIKRKKARLSLSLDNYGNSEVGRYQGVVSAQLLNPFGANESVVFSTATSNKNKALRALNVGYLKRLNSLGTSANFLFAYLRNNPFLPDKSSTADLMYKGELEHYFIINNTNVVKLEAAVERRMVKTYEPLRVGVYEQHSYNVLSLVPKFKRIDLSGAINDLVISLYQTVGATKQKYHRTFDRTFNYVKLETFRDQPLRRYTRHGTNATEVSLFLQAKAQYSQHTLPLERRFGIDGHSVGIGYRDGLVSGNKGLAMLAELRYTSRLNRKAIEAMQPYVFAEAVSIFAPGAKISRHSFGSAGAGLRLLSPWSFRADLGIAFPFSRKVIIDGAPNRLKPVKLSFFVVKEFAIG